ncbi:hypothetical protein BH10CHL1_BH10CHL1_15420 [soil metagenome]
MTTFTWLLVAHLVGDWMLQNDWMARHKQSGLFNPAIAVHCITYTLTALGSLWLTTTQNATHPPYLIFSLFILLSHWIIDATGLAKWWVQFFRQSELNFVQLMVDQTMHIVVLACLTQFLL